MLKEKAKCFSHNLWKKQDKFYVSDSLVTNLNESIGFGCWLTNKKLSSDISTAKQLIETFKNIIEETDLVKS